MSNIKSGGTAKKKKAAPPVVMDEDAALDESGLRPLTELQKRFVEKFLSGPECAGNSMKAAIAAGYSETSAYVQARALLEKPHITAAIEAGLREEVSQGLTVRAVRVVNQILESETASLSLKGQMAVEVIKISGLGDRVKTEKARQTGLSTGQNLAEMSRADLERVVRQGADILRAAAALPPAGPVLEGEVLGDSAQSSAQPKTIAAE